jgi:hypothetical protein
MRAPLHPEALTNLVNNLDDATKIAVLVWAFKHLVEHAQDGGSFRQLVYDRLRLPAASYTPLLNAGGVTISTHFSLMGRCEPSDDSLRMPVTLKTEQIEAAVDVLMNAAPDTSPYTVVEALWSALLKKSGRDKVPPAPPVDTRRDMAGSQD